jgi:predicted RNA-binding protein with RPS1 domain
VLSVDPTERRVALSLREAETAVDLLSIKVGSNVEGTVDRVERYGVFVKLRQGGRALLPANETGTPPGTDLARAFPIGQELELQIIAIDDQSRIKVSKTARDQSEERSRVDRYNRSQSGGGSGFGTLGDLLAAKQKKKR